MGAHVRRQDVELQCASMAPCVIFSLSTIGGFLIDCKSSRSRSIFAPPATVLAIDTDLEMKRLRRKESFTDRTISGFAPQFGAAT